MVIDFYDYIICVIFDDVIEIGCIIGGLEGFFVGIFVLVVIYVVIEVVK